MSPVKYDTYEVMNLLTVYSIFSWCFVVAPRFISSSLLPYLFFMLPVACFPLLFLLRFTVARFLSPLPHLRCRFQLLDSFSHPRCHFPIFLLECHSRSLIFAAAPSSSFLGAWCRQGVRKLTLILFSHYLTR